MAERDKGGKTDMERLGIFQELGYISIGDPYKVPKVVFNDSSSKGKQMLPGGSKIPSALQHGYFSDKFNRVMEGEGYSDPIRLGRLARMEGLKKNLGKPFLPSNGDKTMNGLGTHFGTVGGNVEHFIPNMKPGDPYKSPGKNVLISPGKKGTGYGYQNITIGKYPEHPVPGEKYDAPFYIAQKEIEYHKRSCKGGPFRLGMHPQDYFDINPYKTDKVFPEKPKPIDRFKDLKAFKPSSPGKMPGGCKMGTFDPFPNYVNDPYTGRYKLRPVLVVNKMGKIFMPQAGPKSMPQNSIVDQNILRSMNIKTYRDFAIKYKVI